jgi:hypothetical protein
MTSVLSFMNTFFVASLLICCILVLMLIYNFRQRLTTLENSNKTLLEIVNNVVQKLSMLENNPQEEILYNEQHQFDSFYQGGNQFAQENELEEDAEGLMQSIDEDDEEDNDNEDEGEDEGEGKDEDEGGGGGRRR